MERTARDDLERFDMLDADTAQVIHTVYRMALDWSRSKPALDINPTLPKELRNRVADNWRPLIAIADCFGPEWGKRARDAALTCQRGYHDDDVGVFLLTDTRELFRRSNADRMASEYIGAELHELTDADGASGMVWSEYRGIRDNQPPHKITQRLPDC
jgi:hypothetical protein